MEILKMLECLEQVISFGLSVNLYLPLKGPLMVQWTLYSSILNDFI